MACQISNFKKIVCAKVNLARNLLLKVYPRTGDFRPMVSSAVWVKRLRRDKALVATGTHLECQKYTLGRFIWRAIHISFSIYIVLDNFQKLIILGVHIYCFFKGIIIKQLIFARRRRNFFSDHIYRF